MKLLKILFFSVSTPHTLELSHIFQIFTWTAHFLILSISVLFFFFFTFSSVQSLSCVWFFVTPWTAACQASCPFHQLPQHAQTHVHRVGDAIQPSHLLSSPSPLAFTLSQNQGLFQLASSSHQVAKVVELQLQHLSFQWMFRTDILYDWLIWSPCSPRDSRVFSSTTVQKHQFFGTQHLYSPTLTSIHEYWKNHSFD